MGSASRPHRRARSSKVSYKDSGSEEEDEDFTVPNDPVLSKSAESKEFTRRNLALKKVSRSQERAEALQIQQAIEESLSQGKENGGAGSMSLNVADNSKEIDDSEEDAPNLPSYTTNGAGLHTDTDQEIVKSFCSEDCLQQGIQIPSNKTVYSDDVSEGQGVIFKGDLHNQKGPEAMDTNIKVLKAARQKEDLDWSSEDDDDDDDDASVTEDESSDASEDLKRKRKVPVKPQQKGKKAPSKTEREQKPLTAPVKKPRSARAVSEAGAQLKSKKSLPPKGIGIKPVVHARLADCTDETYKSSSFDTSKKHVTTSKESKGVGGKGILLKGCKSAILDAQRSQNALHSKALSLDATCESPGILAFPAQSPTGLHRRVIGLSRRFKPPPLHPYLSKMQG